MLIIKSNIIPFYSLCNLGDNKASTNNIEKKTKIN